MFGLFMLIILLKFNLKKKNKSFGFGELYLDFFLIFSENYFFVSKKIIEKMCKNNLFSGRLLKFCKMF